MKTIAITIVVWMNIISASAQKISEKHFDFSGKENISLDIQIADSINLQTWNKNEVFVKAVVNVNENRDNDAYQISFGDENKSLSVSAKFKEGYFKGKKNCCVNSSIYWEIYIPEKKPFDIESIDANITIRGETGAMRVKSISGFIDLSFPSRGKADLNLSTITGTIYSDHNLISGEDHTGLPVRISEKLNSGGASVCLESISGNIYFRKAE